MKLASCHPAGV